MSYSDLLIPRRDVLSEDGIEGIIDLANLADARRRKLEARPADFFALTYPTADARRVIDTIHRRFSGNRDARLPISATSSARHRRRPDLMGGGCILRTLI